MILRLTLDDQLQYTESKIGKVPLVSSYFDNMTSSTTSIALSLASVPEADLPLVSLLPELLSGTGFIEAGAPVSYEKMQDIVRREILSLNINFSSNTRSGRVELVVSGAGNDLTESRRAIELMRSVLFQPYWATENLPRIRDLVEQFVGRVRTTRQGPEEYWVMNPVYAWWMQKNPLLRPLRHSSPANGTPTVFAGCCKISATGMPWPRSCRLSSTPSGNDRDSIKKNITALKNKDLADDLTQLIADLPNETLVRDTTYIARASFAPTFSSRPEVALDRLNALRQSLFVAGNARMWTVGSHATLDQLAAQRVTLGAILRDENPAHVAVCRHRANRSSPA